MDIKKLSPEVRQIWRVVKIVQMTMGFTMGIYLFIHGPLFYEKLAQVSNPALAMTLTALLLGILSGLIAVLEVPTGAIGDALGRKKTVLWSLISRMFFFVFLAFIPFGSSVAFVMTLGLLAHIALAFAYTFYSGTFTAWVVDSLRKAAPELGYEHILSRGFTYNFLTQIFGAVIGIFCYVQGYAYAAFLLGALTCIPCLTICAAEMEEGYAEFLSSKKVSLSTITRRMGEIIGLGYQTFRGSPMILWLTLVFASFLFLDNVICYLWPVHLRSNITLKFQNLYWVAIAVGILVSSSVGSHSLTWLSRLWHKKGNNLKTHNATLRRWLTMTCLLCGFSVLALGWFTFKSLQYYQFPLFIFVVLLVEFAYGLVQPCYETLVNNYIPDASSDERATILSFGSMARSLLAVLLTVPAGGHSAEATTIGWMIPAVILLIFTLIARHAMKKKEKEEKLAVQTADEPA